MRNLPKIFIVLVGIVASTWTFAATVPSRLSSINQTADKVIAEWSKNADLGVAVQSLDTGAILYEHNANRYFEPASIQKILTASAALLYLGSDYKFVTSIVAKHKNIQNGTLVSDVYFKFDGDPTLTRKDLDQLVSSLAQAGISRIQGNIYIDDYVFDQKKYGPGWMWDELDTCYAAPAHGIVINKNCFGIAIKPAGTGQIAKVLDSDEYKFTPIISNVITKSSNHSTPCSIDINATENNEYYFSGCLSPNAGTQGFELAVKNIRLYAQDNIQFMLVKYNIAFTGKVVFGKAGNDEVILASHESEPLSSLVKTMLKKSDNQIADSLFKKIAYYYYGTSATWQNGSRAIVAILNSRAHVNLGQVKIVDGSGLSRYNLITPKQMLQVLAAVYQDPKINDVFYNALPISGVDGTLHWRMSDTVTRGKVHAKTGTMTGISNLAGYVQTVSNKHLAFVIMFNTFPGTPHNYTPLEDRICKFLVKQ
jgi:D-alanyl-D-alanine carboxypeptidase/D-alanyl-D-alanine-endopeptidase (penicillin-binding protein 4)